MYSSFGTRRNWALLPVTIVNYVSRDQYFLETGTPCPSAILLAGETSFTYRGVFRDNRIQFIVCLVPEIDDRFHDRPDIMIDVTDREGIFQAWEGN